jgi:hypothetical protein
MSPMTLDTSMFMHHKEHKSFSAEASELGRGRTNRIVREKLFDFVSLKTGARAYFKLNSNLYEDREGELFGWEFVPTEGAIAANPGLKGYCIVIYND